MEELVTVLRRIFSKRKATLKMFAELMGRDQPIEDVIELFDSDQEILFAVIV